MPTQHHGHCGFVASDPVARRCSNCAGVVQHFLPARCMKHSRLCRYRWPARHDLAVSRLAGATYKVYLQMPRRLRYAACLGRGCCSRRVKCQECFEDIQVMLGLLGLRREAQALQAATVASQPWPHMAGPTFSLTPSKLRQRSVPSERALS